MLIVRVIDQGSKAEGQILGVQGDLNFLENLIFATKQQIQKIYFYLKNLLQDAFGLIKFSENLFIEMVKDISKNRCHRYVPYLAYWDLKGQR